LHACRQISSIPCTGGICKGMDSMHWMIILNN
jgi:hypothetical protein